MKIHFLAIEEHCPRITKKILLRYSKNIQYHLDIADVTLTNKPTGAPLGLAQLTSSSFRLVGLTWLW